MSGIATLCCERVRLGGLFTFDIGRIRPLDEVLLRLKTLNPKWEAGYLQLDERFFDSATTKPLVVLTEPAAQLVRVLPNIETIPTAFRQEVTKTCDLFAGIQLSRRWYISSTGVGCLFFTVELSGSINTGQIIAATNALVKYDSIFEFSDETTMSIQQSIDAIRSSLLPCVTAKRTTYVREYSVINILQLAPSTKKRCAKSGLTVYELFQNEWHALCVRTIEEWRERFPAGSTFQEPNRSISPVAVLKMNLRNTVVYEYPYPRRDIEALYDPVFVNTRMWDLLLAVELQHMQKEIAIYESVGFIDASADRLEFLRRIGLQTINEFDGYQLSTSKRTRNLYEMAREVFQIPAMITLFEKKLAYLDQLLTSTYQSRRQENEAENTRRYQALIERSYQEAEQEGASKLLLTVIGMATGLTLALNIVEAYKLEPRWNTILLLAFFVIFSTVYAVAKFAGKERAFTVRGHWPVAGKASAVTLVGSIAEKVQNRIVEAYADSESRGFISFEDHIEGEPVRVRATLTIGATNPVLPANGLLEIEIVATRRSARISWLQNAPKLAASRIVELLAGQLSLVDSSRF
jgi:hypothetical protein